MSRRRVARGAFVAALLAVAGCGGSSGNTDTSSSADEGTPIETGPSMPAATEATAPPVTDPQPPPTSDASEATTTSTPPPPKSPELADIDGITAMSVTTPASGNGERPLLSWAPVDGAADYVVALNLLDGEPYWAWSGPETQIYLGGSSEPPPKDAAGPYLAERMTLRVVAVNADGFIFAASPPFEVAP